MGAAALREALGGIGGGTPFGEELASEGEDAEANDCGRCAEEESVVVETPGCPVLFPTGGTELSDGKECDKGEPR